MAKIIINIILIISMAILFACGTGNSKTETVKADSIIIKPSLEFPKYSSLKEMFDSTGGYSETEGTLKYISENKFQVSSTEIEGENEAVLIHDVKWDIVYASLCAFAFTDVKGITVSAVPFRVKDFRFNKGSYLNQYKQTISINRDKMEKILLKHTGKHYFNSIFKLDEETFIPGPEMDDIQFNKLDVFFNDMKKL